MADDQQDDFAPAGCVAVLDHPGEHGAFAAIDQLARGEVLLKGLVREGVAVQHVAGDQQTAAAL